MALPTSRSVRVTGFLQPLTLYGAFTGVAETAIRDGWLSVVDFWTLGLPQTTGETVTQFLYRSLYGKKLDWSAISSASQAEQLNVGYQRIAGSKTTVMADLPGLAGVSASSELPRSRY